MSIMSEMMSRNMVSVTENDPSKYVKEHISARNLEAASKIDQNKVVSGLAIKAPDARAIALARNSVKAGEHKTYDENGAVKSLSAQEMSLALIKADTEAAAAAQTTAAAPVAGVDVTV